MKTYLSAGLVVIQDNKVLLVHPRNASWWGTFSIPKGKVEPGESPWDTAIRETEEETGLKINKKDTFCAGQIWYPKSKKTVLYFLAQPSERVKLKFKPNDEVDWAGFMTKEEALPRLFEPFKQLLVYLRPEEKVIKMKRTKPAKNEKDKTPQVKRTLSRYGKERS